MTLFFFFRKDCTGDVPLGLESFRVTSQQMTASSSQSGSHPGRGRLRLAAAGSRNRGSWTTTTNNQNQWLQVDFLRDVKITSVATQGRDNYGSQWVTNYKLAYSPDGPSGSRMFQNYQENGMDKVRL